MKIFDTFLKNKSKKNFLELSNLSDDLDDLSLKSSFIFSRIDTIRTNIQDLDQKLKTSKIKIDLAIQRNNLPLAKKAFKNWLLLTDQVNFYKNFYQKSQEEKNKISKNLLVLQDHLDSAYKFHHSNENYKTKEIIKEFRNLKEDLYLYIEKVQNEIPESLLSFTETNIDIDIAFYDYLKEQNIE